MISFILVLVIAFWSWFGYGPRLLRWPSVVVLILLTSGHPLGQNLAGVLDSTTVVLLPLAVALLGIWIMVRGLFPRGARRHRPGWQRDDYERGRRWWDERW